MILKLALSECWLTSPGFEQGSVVSSCENGDEHSNHIIGREFLHQLSDCGSQELYTTELFSKEQTPYMVEFAGTYFYLVTLKLMETCFCLVTKMILGSVIKYFLILILFVLDAFIIL
jgi:hypothetical protein